MNGAETDAAASSSRRPPKAICWIVMACSYGAQLGRRMAGEEFLVQFVDGDFTVKQPKDLLSYYSAAANWLATMGRAEATSCAKAVDNIRHSLKVAGK